MSHDIQIRSGDFQPEVADPLHKGAAPEQMDSLFARLHALLRGRYWWAIGIGSVLAAVGGFGGYKATQQLWTCSGTVQIKMDRDVVLSAAPENQNTQAPEAVKETQIALMRGQRIIASAMGSSEWTALKRPLTDESIAEFMKKLSVVSPGRSEIINVSFSDEDPAAATAAVKGILGAYSGIYVDGELKAEETKQGVLNARRSDLIQQREDKRKEIEVLANLSIGADDLRALHQSNVATITKLQSAIEELKMTISALEGAKSTTRPVKKAPAEMTLAEIEQVDPVMRQLRRELANLEREAQLKLNNLGPHNPRYEEAKLTVQLKKDEIESYATEWRSAAAAAAANPNSLRPGDNGPVTLDQLKQRLAAYTQQAQTLTDDTLKMGRNMLLIEKRKREIADADTDIAEVDRRLLQLRYEQSPAKRISVFPPTDRPLMTRDSRAAYSAAGAIGGMGMGFIIMMLLGLLDRSFRSPEDARKTARMPLLGILPNLPQDLADPQQAAIAAHCVHQIRTLLQLSGGGNDRRVFAITSPAAGTGKTSLTLSLGVSFAASNCKTLVIDCDLIGGGLTARVDTIARRKIGDILLRHHLINDAQLNQALKLAVDSGKLVGQVLVELGLVKQLDIEQALHLQRHDPVGMLDAIDGENLLDCVAETGIERLAILPLGTAMPTDVSKLSPAIIRSILDQARHHFDVVLIDTGPIPGSLEASVAAAAADGVVLVVSRGEHRPMAERSIQHLLDIGAHLAGMVFNRAQSRDMDFATTTKRLSSFDRRGRSVSRQRGEAETAESGFGPMALAVATKAPASGNGTRPRK